MKASFVTILISAFFSTAAFAHGMNKPGPNNGYIKMPGAYHIELVTAKNALKLYILDINFKPLPIETASVKVTLKGLKELMVECTKGAGHFVCDTKDANMKKYTEIMVLSSKTGEKAATSSYALPLSY